jgi:hypothetical protein
MTKYRIQVVESERGWGREYWQEDFDSYDQAMLRIKEINSRNTSLVAPDYYVQADNQIEEIEELA